MEENGNLIKLDYKFKYDEIYYTFKLLAFRINNKIQTITKFILVTIIIYMLIEFYVDKTKSNYYFVGVFSLALLIYLIYYPIIFARRKAKTIMNMGGRCKLSIIDDGSILIPSGLKIEVKNNPSFKSYETENIFIYNLPGSHTFCIPKRVLKDKEIEKIRIRL